jgi:hypothetical protein
MSKKITERTKLKVGLLVFFENVNGPVVQQIAALEDMTHPHGNICVCLNSSPDHKEFLKENGVDVYTRIYKSDLIRQGAEIISVLELICKLEHVKCVKNDLER